MDKEYECKQNISTCLSYNRNKIGLATVASVLLFERLLSIRFHCIETDFMAVFMLKCMRATIYQPSKRSWFMHSSNSTSLEYCRHKIFY